jgi:hypothetical protein
MAGRRTPGREGTHLQINAELWLVGDTGDSNSGSGDHERE